MSDVQCTVDFVLYSFSLSFHPQAKEKQEELALDMKILEKLLDDTRNEVKEETQRKVSACLKCFNISVYSLHQIREGSQLSAAWPDKLIENV